MSETPDIGTIRRSTLRYLVERFDGVSNLAKMLGLSGPSYISQMLSAHRPITEKSARAFEETLGLPSGWMDTPPDLFTLGAALTSPEKPSSDSSPRNPRVYASKGLLRINTASGSQEGVKPLLLKTHGGLQRKPTVSPAEKPEEEPDLFRECSRLVGRVLEEEQATLQWGKFAELVNVTYDIAMQTRNPKDLHTIVRRIIRLLA